MYGRTLGSQAPSYKFEIQLCLLSSLLTTTWATTMRARDGFRKEEMLFKLMIMSTFTEQFMQTLHTHKF